MLRQEKGVSQRKAAAELGVSQALLSHYENGVREPGLNFVTKACDYYNVSADLHAGPDHERDGAIIVSEDLYDACQEKGNVLKGSIMATLQKKLVGEHRLRPLRSAGQDGQPGGHHRRRGLSQRRALPAAAAACTGLPGATRATFAAARGDLDSGKLTADMMLARAQYAEALEGFLRGRCPTCPTRLWRRTTPAWSQSVAQVFHTTDERLGRLSKQ